MDQPEQRIGCIKALWADQGLQHCARRRQLQANGMALKLAARSMSWSASYWERISADLQSSRCKEAVRDIATDHRERA